MVIWGCILTQKELIWLPYIFELWFSEWGVFQNKGCVCEASVSPKYWIMVKPNSSFLINVLTILVKFTVLRKLKYMISVKYLKMWNIQILYFRATGIWYYLHVWISNPFNANFQTVSHAKLWGRVRLWSVSPSPFPDSLEFQYLHIMFWN